MEEIIISSSSSSPSLVFPSTLQERLQFIVQNQPDWWAYAIFWQTTNDENGCLCLAWRDGHFQGNKYTSPELYSSHADKRKCNSEIQTLSMDLELPMDGDVMDAEWFYVMSVTKIFSSREGLPGKAFSTGSLVWLTGAHELQVANWDRAMDAHMHGIRTLVCIPTSNGVLEIGSPDSITKNMSLVQQAKYVFGSDSDPILQVNTIRFKHQNITMTDIGLVACTEEEENGTYSGSKSQEAGGESDRSDTNCHFLAEKPTQEVKIPKKRGRKPGVRREPTVNHVEAERQRREKLNHRFYALRAAVPNVSRMDKASVLEDAVSYIGQLKAKVAELKSQLRKDSKLDSVDAMDNQSTITLDDQSKPPPPPPPAAAASSDTNAVTDGPTIGIDVKFMGTYAMIKAQSNNANYPGARLMDALRDLKIQVHHVSMSVVNNTMLQDVTVKVPEEMKIEKALKDAIVSKLDQ